MMAINFFIPMMLLFILAMITMSDYSFDYFSSFISLSSYSLSFSLDTISMIFFSVVLMIFFSVYIFSLSYMQSDSYYPMFISILSLFVMSMMCLIFLYSIPGMILGWDGLGITSFLLVMYYYSTSSLNSSILTVLTNRWGDGFIIMFLCLAMANGDFFVSMVLLFMGAMTKSAQVPYSSWLPAAMAAPTPVSSLVHSSTLVTAGIYMFMRYLNIKFFLTIIVVFGTFTSFLASLAAVQESDSKKIVALSTLSQLGFMSISLGSGWVVLCFFHLVTHAFFKASLFIAVGNVIHGSVSQSKNLLMLSSIKSPMSFTAMKLCTFSMMGVSFLCGFFSKDMILENTAMSISISCLLLMIIWITVFTTCLYSWNFIRDAAGGYSATMETADESDFVGAGVSQILLVLAVFFSGNFLMETLLSSKLFMVSSGLDKLIPTVIFFTVLYLVAIGKMNLLVKSFLEMVGLKSFYPYSSSVWSFISSTNLIEHLDRGWGETGGSQGIFGLLTVMVQKPMLKISIAMMVSSLLLFIVVVVLYV